MSDEIVERIDQLIAMFALVNKDALTEAATELRGDDVNAAILDAAQQWIAAGELTKKIATGQGVSDGTVRNRISELLTMRPLKREGSGTATKYQATGLV